jgi:manganese transport protein
MPKDKPTPPELSSTEKAAALILSGKSKKRGLARLLPFMGPAFIASVAYMDPGNFATNIQGGAQFGYTLLWVIVVTNLMAMLIQTLSAKLGIASGRNLAELCREYFPRPVVIGMWVIMEIVAMATDLAEFLGAALGFYLLLGIPLWIAGFITAIITFVILGLERYGFRPLEAVITAMIGVISLSYLVEILLGHPDWRQVAYHSFVPQFSGSESVLLAVGILGATVMPHVIFLHSSLTQKRIIVRTPAKLRLLFKFELVDVLIAMGVAGMINAAMLMMAAATFYHAGMTTVGTIQEAYLTLQPLLGKASGVFFALALLASGLSSSSVGTMAGQVIMQGFLQWHVPVWIRRIATMLPALIVILIGLDPTRTLVISQVVLSFGLPFAVIPLIIFTSRRKVMKTLVNLKITTIVASLMAALVVFLNIYLIVQTFAG